MVVPGNKKCANIMTSGKKLKSSVIAIWQEPKQENVKKILKKTLLLLRFFEVQIRSN